MSAPEHPQQPIVLDEGGGPRFKPNRIVVFLKEQMRKRGITLDDMLDMGFSTEDWEQFTQLIGYSVSGWGDLGYIRREKVAEADRQATLLRRD